jgi:hypothetical protein
MGRKGQKTGAGWYRYEKGDRTPHPDEVVKSVIADVAKEFGIPQRTFTDEEILRRLLLARSTRRARSWKKARPTARATSTSCGCTASASRAIAAGSCSGPTTVGSKEILRADRGVARALRRALETVGAAEGDRSAGGAFREAKPKKAM